MLIIDRWRELLYSEGLFELQNSWQCVVVIAVLLITSKCLKSKEEPETTSENNPVLWVRRNRSFLVFWILIASVFGISTYFQFDASVLRFFAILGAVWIVIGFLTGLISNLFWSRSIAAVAYFLTGALGLARVDKSIEVLRSLSFTFGATTISAWHILFGIFAFAFSLWIVMAIAGIIEIQIKRIPRISGSLQVLIVKMIRILMITIAAIVAMSSIGLDLSAITVLSGAIGLGVGFGLQKVISNFISGILLLIDNSIKPGDVIEIDGTYGWINNLRTRYVSVITRDGTEHLIPNEDLITQRVINWTFTDNKIRLKVGFGISYNNDPHQAIPLAIEAAQKVDRVLDYPIPNCNLTEFGDNSVNFELRFWISDPTNGVSNVKSQVLLNLWDALKEHNIEIPFPQRDLHIRSSSIDLPIVNQLKPRQNLSNE